MANENLSRFILKLILVAIVAYLVVSHFKVDEKNFIFENLRKTRYSDELIEEIASIMNDKFSDLEDVLSEEVGRSKYKKYWDVVISDQETSINPNMSELTNFTSTSYSSSLHEFHMSITKKELYPENSEIVEKLLHDLRTLKIKNVFEKAGGTQLKLLIEFENGMLALLKPMRYPRHVSTKPNSQVWNDIERHNAEIAAFHVDKVLGFRRAMPVAGRIMNITTEILPFAEEKFVETFFLSAADNICFYGNCRQLCNSTYAFCGNPDMIEVSLAAYLPTFEEGQRTSRGNPWKPMYSHLRKALWEFNGDYCDVVREYPPYNNDHFLLILADLAIFDFLIMNRDRHHFEMFSIFGDETFPLHLDQGRSLGNAHFDDVKILATLLQCCMIRASTLRTLLKFHVGETKLSDAVRESMKNDAVAPVLLEEHLQAMDRRVALVLQSVRDCLEIENELVDNM